MLGRSATASAAAASGSVDEGAGVQKEEGEDLACGLDDERSLWAKRSRAAIAKRMATEIEMSSNRRIDCGDLSLRDTFRILLDIDV